MGLRPTGKGWGVGFRRGCGACPLPCGHPGGLSRRCGSAVPRRALVRQPRPAPGTPKTTTNQASQFGFRNTPIGLESHSKVPPCARVGPLLQPVVFVACFIGWRPASRVVSVCFVSGGLNWAFPVDRRVSVISDTSHVLGSKVGVSGGSPRPGRRGCGRLRPALWCASRCAAAPKYLGRTTRSGRGDPAPAHGPTRALPCLASPTFGRRCDGFQGVQNSFSSAILSWQRVPEPHLRQTPTPKAGDVLNAFLCGGPKSSSFGARNKIWVNCSETCAGGGGDA